MSLQVWNEILQWSAILIAAGAIVDAHTKIALLDKDVRNVMDALIAHERGYHGRK